jgi:hypothetical protein
MMTGPSRATETGLRVRITYTEPEFQRRNPGTPAAYVSEFVYPGICLPEEARVLALREWDFCAACSGVGWRRVIHSIQVESL